MPSDMTGASVNDVYYAWLDGLSDPERFGLVFDMTNSMIKAVRHQVRQENPTYSPEQVKIAAARIIYYDDPTILRMLDEAWALTIG